MPCFSVANPESEYLEITLIGMPANPKTEGYAWIMAHVKVQVVGFTGEAEINLDIADVNRFQEQLTPVYDNLTGTAEFTTIEDQLYIHIAVDKLGHVQATGYLRGDLCTNNQLNFELNYDQTLLYHTIAEIDDALFELSQQRPEH